MVPRQECPCRKQRQAHSRNRNQEHPDRGCPQKCQRCQSQTETFRQILRPAASVQRRSCCRNRRKSAFQDHLRQYQSDSFLRQLDAQMGRNHPSGRRHRHVPGRAQDPQGILGRNSFPGRSFPYVVHMGNAAERSHGALLPYRIRRRSAVLFAWFPRAGEPVHHPLRHLYLPCKEQAHGPDEARQEAYGQKHGPLRTCHPDGKHCSGMLHPYDLEESSAELEHIHGALQVEHGCAVHDSGLRLVHRPAFLSSSPASDHEAGSEEILRLQVRHVLDQDPRTLRDPVLGIFHVHLKPAGLPQRAGQGQRMGQQAFRRQRPQPRDPAQIRRGKHSIRPADLCIGST